MFIDATGKNDFGRYYGCWRQDEYGGIYLGYFYLASPRSMYCQLQLTANSLYNFQTFICYIHRMSIFSQLSESNENLAVLSSYFSNCLNIIGPFFFHVSLESSHHERRSLSLFLKFRSSFVCPMFHSFQLRNLAYILLYFPLSIPWFLVFC